ncbi:MAG TPA: hypothetical protein VHE83_11930 [Mycobacteriales bacterium]|nr:hypothetical protein [Mycobacteriales bacterium]
MTTVTTSVTETVAAPDGPTRSQLLATRVRTLSSRGRARSKDRWMLVVGGVLVPLGVLLVFLGWLGASKTPLLFEQIPYLISGGQLGLALVVGGGFVYFTYWQAVRVREARAQHTELMAALARLETTMASPAVSAPTAPQRRRRTPAP